MSDHRAALVRLRRDAGFTQESLAAHLEVSRSSVARWERGEGGLPHPAVRHRLAASLDVSVDHLDALFDDAGSARSRSAGTQPCTNIDDETPAGVAHHQVDPPTPPFDTTLALEEEVGRIVEVYEVHGPAVLHPRVERLRSEAAARLERATRLRDRVDLSRLVARSDGLLAYMAVNQGRFRLAEAYCGEALHLADESRDVELSMWIRGTQSFAAYYDGAWELAVAYARLGRSLAPLNPQAIRLLTNGEARALARLDRHDEAEDAVDEALRLLDRTDAPPELTPCISFEPYGYPRVAANAATARVPAGDVRRVLELTDSMAGDVDAADSAWSRSLIDLDVAATLLVADDPEVDRAAALGHRALVASADRPIRSIWQRALELRRLAHRWAGHRAVADYLEAHDAWQAAAAPRLRGAGPQGPPQGALR